MPGTLYVVATPIGNLEDVTLRALRILREVSVIAAEDTRRTARLLQQYSISTPTTSLHQHNEGLKTEHLLGRLAAGESIALVSDAGTPAVSDPGRNLVAAAHTAGIRVEPIPGPSAPLAALSASGLPAEPFCYVGFPPSKGNARKNWFASLADLTSTIVLFEAPHRLHRTLTDLLSSVGDRKTLIGRELTKAHEELTLLPLSEHLKSERAPRGEYTLVVAPHESTHSGHVTYNEDLVRAAFEELVAQGSFPRAAIRLLAQRYVVPARVIYSSVHNTSDKSAD
ncbi:MAG: 16S rRNA (cytidine(1402)-2'-O)-methyltransferase [Vicinamibacterales bacterium]